MNLAQTSVLRLAGIGVLMGCAHAPATTVESEVYSMDSGQHRKTSNGSQLVLKAGEQAEIAFEFSEPMAMVTGRIGSLPVLFQPNEARKEWRAKFMVPSFDELGPEKSMKVFGNDLGGTSIVGEHDSIPAEMLMRGANGEFPKIEGDDYIIVPIVK